MLELDHDRVLRAAGAHNHGVGVVILTYESNLDLLRTCLDSVIASWAKLDQSVKESDIESAIIDILVADNGSPTLAVPTRELVQMLAEETSAPLRFLQLGRNYGFAGGNNRGIAALRLAADHVFLLNPDALVEPNAIATCSAALKDQPSSTLSVAPKIVRSVSAFDEPTIDAIANAVNEKGEAFNIGLGQPDIGQYDESTPCFGPCFGAAMIRRSAFDDVQVGGLDESLFLYYEDVDWNWRAQILGFDSCTAPSAVVQHVMSASTRDRPYDFKFHLTERNLVLCVLKCVEGPDAYRIALWRILGLLRGAVRGHYPAAGVRAVCGVIVRFPAVIGKRRKLQRQRMRSHDAILAFGHGEPTFFDAVRYEPTDRDAARAFAQARRKKNVRF